jgi:hypothetical protein
MEQKDNRGVLNFNLYSTSYSTFYYRNAENLFILKCNMSAQT